MKKLPLVFAVTIDRNPDDDFRSGIAELQIYCFDATKRDEFRCAIETDHDAKYKMQCAVALATEHKTTEHYIEYNRRVIIRCRCYIVGNGKVRFQISHFDVDFYHCQLAERINKMLFEEDNCFGNIHIAPSEIVERLIAKKAICVKRVVVAVKRDDDSGVARTYKESFFIADDAHEAMRIASEPFGFNAADAA